MHEDARGGNRRPIPGTRVAAALGESIARRVRPARMIVAITPRRPASPTSKRRCHHVAPQPGPEPVPPLPPLALGVCSWSLQVGSIAELRRLLDRARDQRGADRLRRPPSRELGGGRRDARRPRGPRASPSPARCSASPARTTPRRRRSRRPAASATPPTRPERLERLRWALDRTVALGLSDLMLHAGFLPEPDDPDRPRCSTPWPGPRQLAAEKGVTLAFETGQETADLLRRTLDELKAPNLKVNFDPANMLLYDMGDPIRAVEILGPDIRSVHVKDAQPPDDPRPVGRGGPARPGRGQHPRVRADPQAGRLHRPAGRRARGRRPGRRGSATSRTAWPSSANAWPGDSSRSRDASPESARDLHLDLVRTMRGASAPHVAGMTISTRGAEIHVA